MSGLGAQAKDVMSAKCGPNHTGRNTVEKQLGENKMKKWQDKTDEEVRLDVRKMVIKGKLTPWNEWDYITTVAEAKDYVEAIYEEWDKESQAANDSIVEILESYFEFIDIFERTIKAQKITPSIKVLALKLVTKRREEWGPILEKAKELQKRGKENGK